MMKIKPDMIDKIHSARQRSVEQTASRMERTYGQEVIAIKKRLSDFDSDGWYLQSLSKLASPLISFARIFDTSLCFLFFVCLGTVCYKFF